MVGPTKLSEGNWAHAAASLRDPAKSLDENDKHERVVALGHVGNPLQQHIQLRSVAQPCSMTVSRKSGSRNWFSRTSRRGHRHVEARVWIGQFVNRTLIESSETTQ